MFEQTWSKTPESSALVDRICGTSRVQNQAAGQRLVAIGELDTLRAREHVADAQWVTDTFVAVAAEVAAALNVSEGLASSFLRYARAMRDRLPRCGALLLAGDIDYWLFQTMVFRTDLITDPDILTRVDSVLAAKVWRWSSLTQRRLAGYVDKIVARADRDAVRQRRKLQADREVVIVDSGEGVSSMYGRLLAPDARILDVRLDALAATVCDHDPRTLAQRRADALCALATGAQRLDCCCRRTECSAADKPTPKPMVIHVIAEQASLAGTGQTPGTLIGDDELIPAELLVELAHTALLRPLVHPAGASPEQGYVPSRALADFVRCRDLTCRFPGCDKPATDSDLDHTIAYADGGPTHASNLKCLCRRHHLVKTFLRWADQQLPDGTVIWHSPSGHTYVTTPGSAWLFPQLCVPTGDVAAPAVERRCEPEGDRALRIPRRSHTRAENHARYVVAERSQNRRAREARRAAREAAWFPRVAPAAGADDPPPF
ncbi:MAG: HNH endonuclease signature motif containing protein [Mycobacterium sp.]